MKHRLVGAAALALAAAVVLPLVLRDAPPEARPPAAPPSDPAPAESAPSPNRIRIVSLGGGDAGVPALPPRDRGEAVSPAAPPSSADPPRSASAGGGSARPSPAPGWAVQVGSFVDPRNADNLRTQIASQGFRAFTQQVRSQDGKPRVRVLVGPDEKRSAAAARLSRLRSEAAVEGFLVRYPG